MPLRRLILFQLVYWFAAAFLLFLYGLQYGHWQVAVLRHLYFPVLAFPYVWAAFSSAVAAVATALILNPVTFALAESGWLHRPVRIIGTDTLYFALFYYVWSLIFLRLDQSESVPHVEVGGFIDNLTVGAGEELRSLHLADVECLLAEGDYVELATAEKGYLKKASLTGMLARLDPAHFARVHRSAAVNRDKVTAVVPQGRGAYEITLVSGRKVTSSRAYKDVVAELLPPA